MMSQIRLSLFSAAALVILFVNTATAQEVSIVSHLKSIESGDIDDARSALKDLKDNYPDDPSVKFLDAVLTTEGLSALAKYNHLLLDHPNSAYADAAVYRIFSYYYSIGSYKQAEEYLDRLKTEYPSSPYIRAANRSIPDEDLEFVPLPEPTVTETLVPESAEYNYTVQAGAFLNITNAQNLSKKFEKDGHYSSVFPKEAGGSILNVVVVGKFKTKDEARGLLKTLEDDYQLKGSVIKFSF